MNRSFRGRESLMPSIRQSVPQLKSLHSNNNNTVRDKEDDLALFLEMRKRDKEKSDRLLLNHHSSDDLIDSFVSQPGSSPLFDIPTAKPARRTGSDDFLNSDGEKNDYDWLLTPPGTPLFPSLDMDSRKIYMDEAEAPKSQPTALRSRLASSQLENNNTTRSNLLPRQPSLSSSVSGLRRPSSSGGPGSRPPSFGGPGSRPSSSCGPGSRPPSSGGPGSRPVTPGGSRPATPTSRPTLTSSRSSRPSTPTSRTTLPSSKPAGHSSPKPTGSLSTRSTISGPSARSAGPSRSSTPTRTTSRPTPSSTVPSRSSTPTRSTASARSSTPTRSTARSSTPTRSTARSSTPTARPSAPPSRSTSRTSPTRRPSTPSSLPIAMSSASLNKSSSSLSSKSGSGPSRNPVPSRGSSPAGRSRPWNPSEMPGFSLEAPPNLRTTLPDRPLSATRGRPTGPSARSASVEPTPNGSRQRRISRSPSRGRALNGHSSGSSVPAVSRAHSRVNDDVSPVVMGTKMVERVVHMRKLAPPRQDDRHSPGLSGKSASSPDSSGFGRTLSKKSLDMAIRHMGIRQSIPGNLRPLMTKIPASSMYSVRSGPNGRSAASVSDSPIATSSNASSDLSFNNHVVAFDGHGSEMDDDITSERHHGHGSPISVHGR